MAIQRLRLDRRGALARPDLIVGDGASLDASDRLYFAAGPEDETQGLFGSLSLTGDAPL